MLFFYRLILTLAYPVLALRFLWRALRRHESFADLRDRLFGPPSPPQGALWVHGASVGEIASARRLVEIWAKTHPVLITANTPTGRDRAKSWGLGGVSPHLAPLDLRWTQRRLLSRCAGLVVLENELWPNRLLAAHAAGVPVALVGARLSQRSAAAWTRRPSVAAQVLGPVAALSAQDEASEERFRSLGLPPDRILPRADLKSLYDPEPLHIPLPGWSRERTVLFASTHKGEEETLLAAFATARRSIPDLCLILAPRHPDRGNEVAALITAAGLGVARRSKAQSPGEPVYLADTMGEMAAWYAAAAVTFVGGSLVEKGGHTPYEPAAFGSAIVHGPFVSTFAHVYDQLGAAGGAVQAETVQEISDALCAHLVASPLPARARDALSAGADAETLARSVLAVIPA